MPKKLWIVSELRSALRGFIGQQQTGRSEQGSGDGELLLLTTGEIAAMATHSPDRTSSPGAVSVDTNRSCAS